MGSAACVPVQFVTDIHVLLLKSVAAASQAQGYYHGTLNRPHIQKEWKIFNNGCLSNLLIVRFSPTEFLSPPCYNLICKQTNPESFECGGSKLIFGLNVYPWKSTVCSPPELNHEHGSSQPASCSVRSLVSSPWREETGKAGEATRLSSLGNF